MCYQSREKAPPICLNNRRLRSGVAARAIVAQPGAAGYHPNGVRADHQVGEGQPAVRVRIGSQAVPLWAVSTSSADERFDRSVFAGEADGRWLWLVLRPASAMLLLRDDWILRDVSSIGPPLVEMPFGGPRPVW